ncbi:MAG: LPS-assembly protein LptD [Gemmatimonadetes bacterium]|nr:LPS-assembly protein LptD [Gemmatimonadota bacterium]
MPNASSAQQQPKPRPELRERVLERLRALDGAARPEPTDTPSDTFTLKKAARPAGAAPPSPAAQTIVRDSVMEALLKLEGFQATEYQGAGARYDADSGRVVLLGKAQVLQAGQSMTADSLLVFDQERSIVCGYGKPVLTGEGAPVESDQVCYNTDRQLGLAMGAKTQFTENATWFVHGERVYTAGSDRLYGENTEFTDCDLEFPHYHFAAGRMKIVHDNVLVARNVTLNFQDVPVFWLPFMVQSLKQGRRSGLLTPRFSVNDVARTQSDYNRRISNVGLFWAISDHLGAEAALDWFSEHFTALDGRLDYRWVRQFLSGGLTFRRFWRAGGGSEFTLTSSNAWQPGERTNVSVSANYASSTALVRRFSYDPRELNRTIDSNASLSHRFGWGQLTLGARRQQFLSEDRIDLALPSLSLSLNPVTLFAAPGTDARWYNNATWSGNLSLSSRSTDLNEAAPRVDARDRANRSANVGSSVGMRNFSWSQSFSVTEDVLAAKPQVFVFQDTILQDTIKPLPRELTQRLDWSTSVSYLQRLVGTSTLTPGLSIGGSALKSPKTSGDLVSAPVRLNFNASLKTDIFGFWPGVRPFSRMRHRISPTLSYTYSPKPRVTPQQDSVFGAINVREQNVLTLSFNQTFEAKYRAADTTQAAPADTAASQDGGPRRRPQGRAPLKLLSLTTTPLAYDFVRAREEDRGFQTDQLSNTVSSDLLRGLQLSFTHDLFRETAATDSQPERRTFDPHLSTLHASFSLSGESWLFRVLGLGRARPAREAQADTAAPPGGEPAPALEPAGNVGALMGRPREPSARREPSAPGTWNASLDYTLVRPRAGASSTSLFGAENQMLRGNFSFQPTPNWSVHWSTGYSFSDGEFSDHVLTLSRDLHDWEANFDFIKTQTGNFSFQFRVHLRANPYIKLDYDQRSEPGRLGPLP